MYNPMRPSNGASSDHPEHGRSLVPSYVPKDLRKTISVALQGGGAHGAFTWGVLERLLQDERIEIESLCGTSAGAMNALMVAWGVELNGRKGAIQMLRKFWRQIALSQRWSPLQPSYIDRRLADGRLDYSPAYQLFDFYSLLFSPYQFNPMDYNPLLEMLKELVDFDRLRKSEKTKLYVCATNVKTSRPMVFEHDDITPEVMLASACIPYLYKAVEIDGEFYWDGGFSGNPPIWPLIDHSEHPDILLIQINPINIDFVPKTADEIRDRINTLSFNSSLMHEMRRINFTQKMIEEGYDMHGRIKPIYIHHINPEVAMSSLGVSSKLNADWRFLLKLRYLGQAMADDWIKQHFDHIGKKSTCDITGTFL